MVANFEDLIKKWIFAGLIIFSLLAFIFTSQIDNDVEDVLEDNDIISKTRLNLSDQLGGYRGQGDTQRALFQKDNPTAGFGELTLLSILQTSRTFGKLIVNLFNAIIKLPFIVFGFDPLILGLLILLISALIIFTAWYTWKGGG